MQAEAPMFEEEPPKKKPESEFPRKLDTLSIRDLEEYIEDLKAEITRVETDIVRKKASQEAAASFFK